MGPKKVIQTKENETIKKNPVAGAVQNSGKVKENPNNFRKSASSAIPNIGSQSQIKLQNSFPNSIRQNKKQYPQGNSFNYVAFNARTPSTVVKHSTNANKKSAPDVHTANKNVNTTKKRSQSFIVKDTNTEQTKGVNKTKISQNKFGKRPELPPIHPVILIDESKCFKDKIDAVEEQQNAVYSKHNVLTDSTKKNFNLADIKKILSNEVEIKNNIENQYDTVAICSGGYNEFVPTHTGTDAADILRYNHNKLKIGRRIDKMADILEKDGSKRVLIKTETNLSSDRKQNDESDLSSDDAGDSDSREQLDVEVSPTTAKSRIYEAVSSNTLYDFGSKSFQTIILEADSINSNAEQEKLDPYYIPSFVPEILDTAVENIIEGKAISVGKKKNSSRNDLIKIQSTECGGTKRNENADNSERTESICLTTDLQSKAGPQSNIKEMKQTVSATTVQSSCNTGSFDTKTFIWETPMALSDCSRIEEIVLKSGQIMKIRREQKCLSRQEIVPLPCFKSVLTQCLPKMNFDHQIIKSDKSFMQSMAENYLLSPLCSDKTNRESPAIVLSEDSVTETSSEEMISTESSQNEDIFDCANTLEILNVTNDPNRENLFTLSNEIILSLNSDKFEYAVDDNECTFCEADDEFATVSEEIYDPVNCNNSVWFDYKTSFKTDRPPENSDLWVLEEIISENSNADSTETDTIVLLEAVNKDWTAAESNLEKLRLCLEECTEEAERAAQEINSLKRKSYKLNPTEKFINSNFHLNNSFLKSRSKQAITPNGPTRECDLHKQYFRSFKDNNFIVSNTKPVEDEMDYFSVSSGDELGDIDVKNNSALDKPKKSYLSFGKSCGKMKKKKDKKVLLSLLNFFKS